jgi:hypothetical protein
LFATKDRMHTGFSRFFPSFLDRPHITKTWPVHHQLASDPPRWASDHCPASKWAIPPPSEVSWNQLGFPGVVS